MSSVMLVPPRVMIRGRSRPSWCCLKRLFSSVAPLKHNSRPLKIGIVPFSQGTSNIEGAMRYWAGYIYHTDLLEEDDITGCIRVIDILKKKLFSMPTRVDDIHNKTIIESLRCLYLPYWLVDANIVGNCQSNIGRAEANIFLNQTLLPGHNDFNLQLLPLTVPSPEVNNYTTLDVAQHLQTKVAGRPPEVLPFTHSPFVLGSLLKNSEILFEDIPSLALTRTAKQHETEKAWKSIKAGEKQVESIHRMKLDKGSFRFNYLTASPILLPIYLAEFSNTSKHLKRSESNLTLALPNWNFDKDQQYAKHYEASNIQKNIAKPIRPQWIYNDEKPARDVNLTFSPRIPMPSQLQEAISKIHEEAETKRINRSDTVMEEMTKEGVEMDYENWEKINEKYKKIRDEETKKKLDQLWDIKDEEIRRDDLEIGFVKSILQQRIEDFLETLPWKVLQQIQRSHFQDMEQNTQIQEISPERQSKMGSFIDWNSPQIVSPVNDDKQSTFTKNKLYFKALIEFQQFRNDIFATERTGSDDSNYIYRDGESAGGLLNKKMIELARLAPSWVKDFKLAQKNVPGKSTKLDLGTKEGNISTGGPIRTRSDATSDTSADPSKAKNNVGQSMKKPEKKANKNKLKKGKKR